MNAFTIEDFGPVAKPGVLVQLKDAAGKPRWEPVVSFVSKEVAERWSEGVLQALRQSHPRALDELPLPGRDAS